MYLLENFIGEERIMLNSNFVKEIVKEVLDTSFVSQASFHMAISNTFAINLAENLSTDIASITITNVNSFDL